MVNNSFILTLQIRYRSLFINSFGTTMNKSLKSLLFISLILLCFSSCNDDKEDDYLYLSSQTISFAQSVNEATKVELRSSTDAWEIKDKPDWVNIKYSSKSTLTELEISATPNNDLEERTADIYFYTPTQQVKIHISQQGTNSLEKFITFDQDPLSVGSFSSVNTIKISTNTSWSITNYPTWIHIYPLSGTGSGSITITIDENELAADREATIEFNGLNSIKKLPVTQIGQLKVIRSLTLPIMSFDEVVYSSEGTYSAKTSNLFINSSIYKDSYLGGLINPNMPAFPAPASHSNYTLYPITAISTAIGVYSKTFIPSFEQQRNYAQETIDKKPQQIQTLISDNGSTAFYSYKQLRAIGMLNFGMKLDVALNNVPYTELEMQPQEKGMIFCYRIDLFYLMMDLPENGSVIKENLTDADKKAGISYISNVTYGKIGLLVVETNQNLNDIKPIIIKKMGQSSLSATEQTALDACKISFVNLDQTGLIVQGGSDQVINAYRESAISFNENVRPTFFQIQKIDDNLQNQMTYTFK